MGLRFNKIKILLNLGEENRKSELCKTAYSKRREIILYLNASACSLNMFLE